MWPDRSFLVLLALATSACNPAIAQTVSPETAATGVVERLHGALLDASADPASTFADRYETLAPAVRESYDLDYIVRFILRRQWDELSEAAQNEFRQRFEELSIASYASRFTGLEAGSLMTSGARQLRQNRVQVDAALTADDGRTVTLSYTLDGDGGDWQIINVIADGVSDLALRRSEYSRLLAEDGIDALLRHIDTQIAELR